MRDDEKFNDEYDCDEYVPDELTRLYTAEEREEIEDLYARIAADLAEING